MSKDLVSSLQAHFGFAGFRPGQAEAVQYLLDRQHTLVVMPTGSGKSLVFQLAALNLPGVTLVLSPLIALMKDQVDSLERRGIPATFINSALPVGEQNRRLENFAAGRYRLVYIAPERLRSLPFLEAAQRQTLSLLAVDEAHCISEWGHDFRPDYLHIAQFRAVLGNPLTAALTATATPQVQEDIARLLHLPQIQRVVTGFNRPNLTLEVRSIPDPPARLKALHELLAQRGQGATIVYTGTRRDAEEVADFVSIVLRIPTQYYHAGLPAEERTRIQNAFMAGDLSVIAATNAFGMGIDRPDVRQVIHYSLPGSLEAYYQEAGRAGRDELPARAVLLYAPQDRALQEWFIENSLFSADELRLLFDVLRPLNEKWVAAAEISRQTGLPDVKVNVGLAELERAGVVEHLGDEGLRLRLRVKTWKPTEIQTSLARLKQHQAHRRAQLDRIIAYAESNACRRRIILRHFGDGGPADAEVCCDNCQSRSSTTAVAPGGDLMELSQAERVALILLDTLRRLLPRKVGAEKLAQILKGSKSKDMAQFGYDKSVYYGRLAVFSQVELKHLIDQLLDLRYLKVVGGEYPVLQLTPQGESAIRSKSAIPLELPRQVSSQVIASKKAERQAGGTLNYTEQLFGQGLSAAQIAAQRGLALRTIYSHAAQLIAAGRLPVEAVVADETRRAVEAAIRQIGPVEYLAPLKAILPPEMDYEIIRCVVEGWRRAQSLAGAPAQDGPPAARAEQGAGMSAVILDCVRSLPGRLPRSGVAKLLSGSDSERVQEFCQHPLFNCLAGHKRAEVLAQVDRLLESGQLAENEHGRVILGPLASSPPSDVHYRRAPSQSAAVEIDTPPPEISAEQAVVAFLSRSHPRQLPGPWDAGWSLSFHSQFDGADWKRSQAGELTYRLKYQGDLAALPALVEQAMHLIAEHPELAQVEALVATPPSIPRPNDPVQKFTEALAQRLGLPCLPALVKSRQTAPQKEMHTLAQKRANVAGAFQLQAPVAGKHLLILDDLFDSGATLEEICRLLRRAGAARVCVLTLTRTIHSDA